MPRWKQLPAELAPQVREFTGQLRRIVDGAGLSVAAVADRTGYSKTSWERYLNGRLLAPRGAVVALAEVTGTQQQRLVALWEPAERAWSRSERRHRMTMEAIRLSRARAALGEAGAAPAPAPVPAPAPAPAPAATAGGPKGRGGRRVLAVVLAGAVAVLLPAAAVALFADRGGDDGGPVVAAVTPSARPATTEAELPGRVKCSGTACTGQDPEVMGCGGRFAETVARATVGAGVVEVRYSETCGAAWARITQAASGGTVRITAGPAGESGTVDADADAYTPMVAVAKPSDAKACAKLASGTTRCTTPEQESGREPRATGCVRSHRGAGGRGGAGRIA